MQEFLMYGIMRLVPDEYGSDYARIANPIYQKLLVKTFAPSHSLIRQVPITELQVYHRFMVEDILDTDSLMDSFKDFMEEHGVRLLKSEATNNPLEISGQYMLLSYLTAVLSSIDGYATVESLSVAGEMDIVGFHRGQRFIIETKIWYGKAKYEQGLTQLSNYLRAAGLQKGYMVIFDHKKDSNRPPAEREALGSPPKGGEHVGKAPLGLLFTYSQIPMTFDDFPSLLALGYIFGSPLHPIRLCLHNTLLPRS